MSQALIHTDSTTGATDSTTIQLPGSYLQVLQNRFSAHDLNVLLDSPVKPAFCYGLLMLPKTLVNIFGDGYGDEYAYASRMTPATLHKHQRFGIHSLTYPAVLPSEHDSHIVSGMVLFGLTAA